MEFLGDGAADAGGGSGHDGDLALERLGRGGRAELGLLQIPVFDFKQVPLRQGGPAARGFGLLDGADGVAGDVRNNAGSGQSRTEGDGAFAGPDRPAGRGVEGRLADWRRLWDSR